MKNCFNCGELLNDDSICCNVCNSECPEIDERPEPIESQPPKQLRQYHNLTTYDKIGVAWNDTGIHLEYWESEQDHQDGMGYPISEIGQDRRESYMLEIVKRFNSTPELLAALKELVSVVNDCGNDNPYPVSAAKAVVTAQTAILKAEGNS